MSLINLPEGWWEQSKKELILMLVGLVITGTGIFLLRTGQTDNNIRILSAAGQSSASGMMVIDIEGGVIRPGVYELPEKARVEEALKAAGGLSGEADVNWVAANINRAQELQDGEKIYIPYKSDNLQNISAGNTADNKVSINKASLSQLDSLPGIGPVTADKIIDGRPYKTVDELLEKKVVGQKVFEQIKDLITLW